VELGRVQNNKPLSLEVRECFCKREENISSFSRIHINRQHDSFIGLDRLLTVSAQSRKEWCRQILWSHGCRHILVFREIGTQVDHL
jgi:hypothetical protein